MIYGPLTSLSLGQIRVVQLEKSIDRQKRKKSLCWSLDIHTHAHARAWVPVKILAYWLVCWVMSYWKKLALCTMYNCLRSKLQPLYQLIKCISRKEHVMKEIQTALTADSQWSKHIIKDMKDKRKKMKAFTSSLLFGFLLLWTEKREEETLFSWV